MKLHQVSALTGIQLTRLSEIETGSIRLNEKEASALVKLYGGDLAELLAKSGQIPERVQHYLMAHPAAGVLLARFANHGIGDRRLSQILRRYPFRAGDSDDE